MGGRMPEVISLMSEVECQRLDAESQICDVRG